MATRKMLLSMGADCRNTAVPAQAAVATRAVAEMPGTPRGAKDTIALTVRLDRELYLRLKSHGVGFRPRKTSQDILVEVLKAYLAQAEGALLRPLTLGDAISRPGACHRPGEIASTLRRNPGLQKHPAHYLTEAYQAIHEDAASTPTCRWRPSRRPARGRWNRSWMRISGRRPHPCHRTEVAEGQIGGDGCISLRTGTGMASGWAA